MEIFEDVSQIRAFLDLKRRKSNISVGLVPTMGALHKGHLELIKSSKKENELTVATVYVNPTQFNNPSDLVNYPRTIDNDIALLKEAGCDILFYPSNDAMYSSANPIKLDFGSLDKILEGKFRPGHFSGVGLVVSKLFNIVKPAKAYFGQKDYQQFQVISSLVDQFMFPIALECVPTVREEDGLAMSSRNLRLSPEMRSKALILFKSLMYAKEFLLNGGDMKSIRNSIQKEFDYQGVTLEYLELASRKNLNGSDFVTEPNDSILLIAGYVGEVRLIDNIFLV